MNLQEGNYGTKIFSNRNCKDYLDQLLSNKNNARHMGHLNAQLATFKNKKEMINFNKIFYLPLCV